ncbi:MAG: hypothetical protein ABI469_10650 [Gemmatimonadales bacterium]
MTADARETAFFIRWADEHAPKRAIVTAMVNSNDLLGSFIFDSGEGGVCTASRNSRAVQRV